MKFNRLSFLGRYGSSHSLTTKSCSGPCGAGYYCPMGATSSKQLPCSLGDPSLFCPPGSAKPLVVSAGFKTILTNDSQDASLFLRVDQVVCNRGHFCIGGLEFPCPLGRYGLTYGLATQTCTDSCSEGEYCPIGSTRARICPVG
jgi:hypothetical protein